MIKLCRAMLWDLTIHYRIDLTWRGKFQG